MAKGKRYHVTPTPEGWQVKAEGAKRAVAREERKDAAVRAGREAAKNQQGQLIVHRQDGRIQEERTYRKDPHPPKG